MASGIVVMGVGFILGNDRNRGEMLILRVMITLQAIGKSTSHWFFESQKINKSTNRTSAVEKKISRSGSQVS